MKTKEDLKQAVSATTVSMFQGLLVTISALYWITPAILFCLIIYIFKISLMENEDKRIKYTILTIYLGVQIIIIQKLFNDHYYHIAPDFLTFYGSSLIIPLLIAMLSGVSLIIGKKQDWSMMISISYFIIVNIIFLSLTVGPYTF
jgi:CDP-diglyceride synthetase